MLKAQNKELNKYIQALQLSDETNRRIIAECAQRSTALEIKGLFIHTNFMYIRI